MTRWPIWLVVLMAGVVALSMPASAAAVGSEHTTTAGFQNGTLVGMSATNDGAQQDSAVTVVDNFSDADETVAASAWSGWSVAEAGTTGSDPFSVNSQNGIESFSGALSSREGQVELRASRGQNISKVFSTKVKISDDNADATSVKLQSGGSNVIGLTFQDGSNNIQVDGTSPETVGTWAPGDVYEITIAPDFSTNTAYVYLNGEFVGSHEMYAASGYDELLIVNSALFANTDRTVYIDDVEVGYGFYASATHTVDKATSGRTNITGVDSARVVWQANQSGTWTTVGTTADTGKQRVAFSGTGSEYRVLVLTEDDAITDPARVESDAVLFDESRPRIANVTPDGPVNNYGGSVSIDLTDSDFPTTQGDSVQVTATDGDGTQIGQTTVTSNQTVSFAYSPDSGLNSVSWVATDSYGRQDSAGQSFGVPQNLTVVNETSGNVTNNQQVNATFYFPNQTATRSDIDGTIDFSGLPPDKPVTVEVRSAGYRVRTLRLPSLVYQQTAYLLHENTTAVQTRFELEDATGTFSDNSTLYVEKPINDSGSVSYQVIVSDQFGVDGVTTFLEKGVRYELRLKSRDGDVAQLGAYGADLNETVILEPEVAAVNGTTDPENPGYEASYDNSSQTIAIEYIDPGDETSVLTVRVVARDGTVIKPSQTYVNVQSLSLSVPTNGPLNQTAYVHLNGTRAGSDFNAQLPVGPTQQDVVPGSIDPVWLQVGAGAVILMVGGLFSALNVGVGATITSLFAGVLWWLGIMSGLASGAAIALAIGLSTLNLLLTR